MCLRGMQELMQVLKLRLLARSHTCSFFLGQTVLELHYFLVFQYGLALSTVVMISRQSVGFSSSSALTGLFHSFMELQSTGFQKWYGLIRFIGSILKILDRTGLDHAAQWKQGSSVSFGLHLLLDVLGRPRTLKEHKRQPFSKNK